MSSRTEQSWRIQITPPESPNPQSQTVSFSSGRRNAVVSWGEQHFVKDTRLPQQLLLFVICMLTLGLWSVALFGIQLPISTNYDSCLWGPAVNYTSGELDRYVLYSVTPKHVFVDEHNISGVPTCMMPDCIEFMQMIAFTGPRPCYVDAPLNMTLMSLWQSSTESYHGYTPPFLYAIASVFTVAVIFVVVVKFKVK